MKELSDMSGLEAERQEADRQMEMDWKTVNDVINENARMVQNQKEYAENEMLLKRYKGTEAKQKEIAARISDRLARRKKTEEVY